MSLKSTICQGKLMKYSVLMVMVLCFIPISTRAATILAAIQVEGVQLTCESPLEAIAGEEVAGRALILGLDFNYEVQVDDSGRLAGRVVNNPIKLRKNLDACTPLLLQALVRLQPTQVIITIYDTDSIDGSDRAKTRLTLNNARIIGVNAIGDMPTEQASMVSIQELIQVLAQQVIVEDLVAGTSFQYNR